MATKQSPIDGFLEKAPELARPILAHLRRLIHEACPQVEESLKWGFSAYSYKGIICMTPAFKAHCRVIFWRSKLLGDAAKGLKFDRITSLRDLPADNVLLDIIRKAAALNEAGIKEPRPAAKPKKPLVIPDDFRVALAKNKKAAAAFQKMPPSHQREYVQWITEAKREETRVKRMAGALKMIAVGKSRNWKYEKC